MTLTKAHRNDVHASESGITVLEVVIATVLLSVALAAFLGSLGSSQSANEFSASRTRSLEDLRLAAGAFTREARQATTATACTSPCSSITLSTYVNGVLTPSIVWDTFTDTSTGHVHLRRTAGGSERVFPLRLTQAEVFSSPGLNRLRLALSTRPMSQYAAVRLETEVALRNAAS